MAVTRRRRVAFIGKVRYSAEQKAGMRHEKALARAVADADKVLRGVSSAGLRAALRREQREAVFDAFPWERWRNALDRNVTPVVRDAFEAGAVAAEHTTFIRKQGVLEGVFDMKLPRAQRVAARRAAELVTNIDRSTRQAMRDIVTRAFRDNVSVRDQADQIERLLYQGAGLDRRRAAGLYNFEQRLQRKGIEQSIINGRVRELRGRMMHDRAVTIARHETLEAAAAGQHETWMQAIDDKRLPKNMEREWITAQDERLCPICAPMNGQRKSMKEPFFSNYSKQKYMRPPAHVMCLPGDALVLPRGRITAASKRWSDEDLVVIQCTDALPLSCTPNHPILTRRGWIAARKIKEGDEVAYPGMGQRVASGDGHDVDVPARIEDVAKAFLNDPGVMSVPMPVAAEDFHGDGVDSQVAVVGADGLLRDGLHAMFAQRVRQYRFKCGHVGHVLLSGASGLRFAGGGPGHATAGVMRSAYLPGSLRRSHAAPLQQFGLRPPTWLDRMLAQDAGDRLAAAPEAVGKAEDGLSAAIEPDDLIFRKVTLRSHRAYSGWVYNLETTAGYYVANGYATHNCRCTIGLVEPKEGKPTAPSVAAPPPVFAPPPAATIVEPPRLPPLLPPTRFTPAATKAEALATTQRFASDISGAEALTLDALNDFNDGMGAVLGPAKIKLGQVGTAKRGSRSMGQYMYRGSPGTADDGILFQKTASRNPAKMVNDTKSGFAWSNKRLAEREPAIAAATKRWAAFQDAKRPRFAIAAHEAGHAVYYRRGLTFRWQRALKDNGVTREMRVGVSQYGATNADELFAETVAMIADGRADELPEAIVAAFRQATEGVF